MSVHGRRSSIIEEFHDPVVLVVWAGILSALLLKVFYQPPPSTRILNIDVHGTCTGLVPCQSDLDLALILAAGLGAGLLLKKEKSVILGFIIAHILSTVFFVGSLTLPVSLGMIGRPGSDLILSLALLDAIALQFPVGILLSFLGCLLGSFIRDRLGIFQV